MGGVAVVGREGEVDPAPPPGADPAAAPSTDPTAAPSTDPTPAPTDGASRTPLEPGTAVEVRNRFQGTWARGFSVHGTAPDGTYLVRRTSDDSVLPGTFARDAIRRERRRRNGWWY